MSHLEDIMQSALNSVERFVTDNGIEQNMPPKEFGTLFNENLSRGMGENHAWNEAVKESARQGKNEK